MIAKCVSLPSLQSWFRSFEGFGHGGAIVQCEKNERHRIIVKRAQFSRFVWLWFIATVFFTYLPDY